MRNAFSQIVTELAAENHKLVLLAGDIGNRLFDSFKEKFPDRFYNCGVAEAGMTGIASGLASCGLQPITYTITPFNTLRCMEQIRLDICYLNLPVIVVGTGSGLSYAGLGATHHSMEDVGALRMLPNMHVVCPADPMEVKSLVKAALELCRPTYIRLGKKGEPEVHKKPPPLEIGKAFMVREGKDIALLSVGNMLSIAMETAEQLHSFGKSTSVISLHTIKPLDTLLLKKLFTNFNTIATIEEHGLAGGAGSAILEWGNQNHVDVQKLLCFGGPDRFLSAIGNQQQARYSLGLDSKSITKRVLEAL